MNAALSAAVGFFSLSVLAFVLALHRRLGRTRHLPPTRAIFMLLGGAAALVASLVVERFGLSFADASLRYQERSGAGSALGMILLCAPLEEALKAAVVWPLYVKRRLVSGQVGAIYAVLSAGGFAAFEIGSVLFEQDQGWVLLLRVIFAAPAHLFFAGLWGYMLGGGRRDRYFFVVWGVSALLHGVYDHIVFGRGPTFLVVVVPMLMLMAAGVFGLLKEQAVPSSERMTAYSLFEPPSVGSVRDVLSRRGRPVMIHWIFIGAFVNLGVTLLFLAVSVYGGHRFGVDFSLADESGAEGIVPIVLLGTALLSAFPVSAYLIARASGAASVLEPAWATGASVLVVFLLFSVTEPTALVIAMGVAPVGFALACVGAWFGLERS